jgi:hypothetical protein
MFYNEKVTMKTIKQGLDEAYKTSGENAYFGNGFNSGVEFAESIILIEDELPSIKNGFVDELVLVCVKNKNKEGGIILWDLSSFDGETWSKRHNTWETIIGWRPILRSKQ